MTMGHVLVLTRGALYFATLRGGRNACLVEGVRRYAPRLNEPANSLPTNGELSN